MYAIIGTWAVDGDLDPDQLSHVAEVVQAQPGFVHGYWGQSPDDVSTAHAVVLFREDDQARSMADGIRAAIPSASLSVVQVLQEA